LAGIVAPPLFAVMVIIESLLRPGYSQITTEISDLGVGNYAILQNMNFIILGILSILFALGLESAISGASGRKGRATRNIIVVFGLGLILAGIFLVFAGAAPTSYVSVLLRAHYS